MRKTSIMIIENDFPAGKEIKNAVEKLGYGRASLFTSCLAAEKGASRTRPDVILMDIAFSESTDEWESVERIRSDLNVPMIFIADPKDEWKLERLKGGTPFGYLIKPATEWRVKTALEMALRLADLRDDPGREKFRLLFERAPIGYQSLDEEGRFIEVNQTWLDLLGYGKEEVIGKSFADFLSPDFADSFRLNFPRFKAAGEIRGVEFDMVKKDGSRILVSFHGKIGKDEQGAFQQTHCVMQDITARKAIEAQLKESEKLFKRLAENLPDVVDRYDRDLRHTYVNPAIETNTGIPVAQFIGKHNEELNIPAHLATQWEAALKKTFDSGQRVSIEFDYPGPLGIRNFHAVLVPEFTDGEEVASILCVSRDITDQKQTEKALRESEEKFSKLFFESPVWSAFTTVADGRFLEANKAFYKITGYSEQEVIGRAAMQLGLWPRVEDRTRVLKLVEQNRRLKEHPVTFRMKDRTLRNFLWSAEAVDFHGELCLLSVLVDVTERNKAERDLRNRERLLFTALNNTDNAIVVLDENRNILFYNRKYVEIWDLDPQYLDTSPYLEDIIRLMGQKGVYAREHLESFISRRMDQISQGNEGMWIDMPRLDGKYVEGRVTMLPDGGFLLAYRDLTERKQMEAELQKTEKLEALGVLAGGIAHDFNNLLAGIIGNISLAKLDLSIDETVYARMEAAENAALRAKDLTYQLLTFAKGGAPVKKTSSISDLITESACFILRGSNVKCKFVIPDDLWPVEIDQGQINQVLNNILLNADQAMPLGGTVLIRAENVRVGASHMSLQWTQEQYVKISISDEGEGMPEDLLPKIFDPFFTTKEKGNGLGLATAHSIIRNHKGYITVDSESGAGTTFHIYLPASLKPEQDASAPNARLPQNAQGKILLVDDDSMVRDVAATMLKRLGFEVETCEDGARGVDLYVNAMNRDAGFDAVIMDLTIPGGMGGEEAIKLLREIDPMIKALVSSGYSNDPIMSDPGKYGFKGVLSKPFRMDELNAELQALLSLED